MSHNQESDNKRIIDMVVKHCNQIQEQIYSCNYHMPNDKLNMENEVLRAVSIGFSLSNNKKYPLCRLQIEGDDNSWSAHAILYTAIVRNSEGYLELTDPYATFNTSIHNSLSYKVIEYDSKRYQKITLETQRVSDIYLTFPENCEVAPVPSHSDAGDKVVVTHLIDDESGELAHIRYDIYETPHRATNVWNLDTTKHNAQIAIFHAKQEFGDISPETAKAYELLYDQYRLSRTSIEAQEVSNQITAIYKKLYGPTSNNPDLIRAYQRDYDSLTTESSIYQRDRLKCLKQMFLVKEAHEEVEFPSVEELQQRIVEAQLLAEKEAWSRFIGTDATRYY